MAHLVEGDWKIFTVKFITKEDYPEVIQHLGNNFFRDEPINVCLGYDNSVDQVQDSGNHLKGVMDHGLSIIVREKETGKVAGVRITGICRKEGPGALEYEFQSEEMKVVYGFLGSAEADVDIFKKFGVDEYIEFFMASVDRQFRGEGIASEMYRRIILYLRHAGFKVVKCSFTSPYTRRISEKTGFQEVARKYFREIKGLHGQLLVPHLGDDHCVAVKVLRLDS